MVSVGVWNRGVGVDKISETGPGVSVRGEAVGGGCKSVLTLVGRMGKFDLQIGSKNCTILLVSVLPSLSGTEMAASSNRRARPVSTRLFICIRFPRVATLFSSFFCDGRGMLSITRGLRILSRAAPIMANARPVKSSKKIGCNTQNGEPYNAPRDSPS